MIYFTSDYHFGHANVIKYCDRPFQNIQEMDAALVENTNKIVGPKDWLYILGDVAFTKNYSVLAGYLKRINGRKIIIAGNHDREPQLLQAQKEGLIRL